MSELTSARNPSVQHARLLARDRKEREASGLAVLEGVRLAEEALSAGVSFEYVLFTDELTARERGAALLDGFRSAGVPMHRCTAGVLASAADTRSPQGVVAVFRHRYLTLADLGSGPVAVLDHLQDPGNTGTVIRSMEALGGGGVVIAGGVEPYNPKVIRAAMGSLFRLPVVQADITEALGALKAAGRKVYVADAGGELLPWTADLRGGAVLVIGNEGSGPSEQARIMSDGMIQIPMAGSTESLNAGVAASLLIYESLRQRLRAGS